MAVQDALGSLLGIAGSSAAVEAAAARIGPDLTREHGDGTDDCVVARDGLAEGHLAADVASADGPCRPYQAVEALEFHSSDPFASLVSPGIRHQPFCPAAVMPITNPADGCGTRVVHAANRDRAGLTPMQTGFMIQSGGADADLDRPEHRATGHQKSSAPLQDLTPILDLEEPAANRRASANTQAAISMEVDHKGGRFGGDPGSARRQPER